MELTPEAFRWIALAVMLFGLLGVLIPVLPDLLIIWVAALVYGLVTGFDLTGGIILGVMTVLMVAGFIVDNVAMGASARQTGASWLSVGVALVAGLVGSIVWPPLGGLFAALLGIFLVEFYRLRDFRKAITSTRGLAIGCGWGVVLRAVFALVMIGVFLLWAFVL